MQNLQVHKGKLLLRAMIGTIVSASMLMGCNSNTKPATNDSAAKSTQASSQEYCINGGKNNKYSCNPELASPQVNLHHQAVDDEWMQDKLAEIKKWIAEEKQSLARSGNATKQATVEDLSSTTNKSQSNEYLTTVSSNNSAQVKVSSEIEHILRQSQQGQHQQALTGINSFIEANPNTPSAELTKGIILSNMGDKQSAKAVFQRLTRNHPERPEAFNNLAVIYAEEGKYPEAIETLQSAFQTHPSYARVHSNLKELYATLASQAYNKALDLGPGNSGPELAMINQTPTSNVSSAITVVSAPTTTVEVPTKPTAKMEPVAIVETPPEPATIEKASEQKVEIASTTESVEPLKAETHITETTKAAERAVTTDATTELKSSEVKEITEETSTVAIAPETTPQPAELKNAKQVESHLQAWAKAWRNQDHSGYIAAYTDNYRPSAKLSHNQWVQQRKVRLSKPQFIKVELNNISIQLLRDNLAEARFDQRYQSDTYKDAVKKRVMLVKTDGQWKISLERSLGLVN